MKLISSKEIKVVIDKNKKILNVFINSFSFFDYNDILEQILPIGIFHKINKFCFTPRNTVLKIRKIKKSTNNLK